MPAPASIIATIERFVLQVVRALSVAAEAGSPEPLAMRVGDHTRRLDAAGARSWSAVLSVLAVSHSLLRQGRSTSQRDVYYTLLQHFPDGQAQCNRAVADCAALLRCAREDLGIYASPRGVLGGRLTLRRGHEWASVEAAGVPVGGAWRGARRRGARSPLTLPLPSKLKTAAWLAGTQLVGACAARPAAFVLVVEKEAVFGRLVSDGFHEECPCVVVTGKGFPDAATRACVAALVAQLGLPAYGLFDYGPFGAAVYLSYVVGGKLSGAAAAAQKEPPQATPSLRWLGMRSPQIGALRMDRCREPLTAADKKVRSRLYFPTLTAFTLAPSLAARRLPPRIADRRSTAAGRGRARGHGERRDQVRDRGPVLGRRCRAQLPLRRGRRVRAAGGRGRRLD